MGPIGAIYYILEYTFELAEKHKNQKSDQPLLRKRVSKKFQKWKHFMKICHFWWGKSHTYWRLILYDNEWYEFKHLPLHPVKKDQQGVPKISNKDPENFRIIASH